MEPELLRQHLDVTPVEKPTKKAGRPKKKYGDNFARLENDCQSSRCNTAKIACDQLRAMLASACERGEAQACERLSRLDSQCQTG